MSVGLGDGQAGCVKQSLIDQPARRFRSGKLANRSEAYLKAGKTTYTKGIMMMQSMEKIAWKIDGARDAHVDCH